MKPYLYCFQVISCLTIKYTEHIENINTEIMHCRVLFPPWFYCTLDDVTILEIVR